MKVTLIRVSDDGRQTLGQLFIHGDEGFLIFSCYTLELPYKDNQRNISCIPKGTYLVKKRNSKYSKFKYTHLHVQDVPKRTFILFHIGNFTRQIEGCILVGKIFADIDNDGLKDVVLSKDTFNEMMSHLPNDFILNIV